MGWLAKEPSAVDLKVYCQSEEEIARKAERLTKYRRMALESNCTLAQLALRFVSRLDSVSVSLIGVSRRQQLDTLLAGIRG